MDSNEPLINNNVMHEADHLRQTMEGLNARIARLSIALRVPLKTDADIQEAMKNLNVLDAPKERRAGIERRSPARLSSTVERRTNHQHSELRGLLVMRYESEIKLVELLGATRSRQMIGSISQNLERHGFGAGAGGALVNRDS